MASTSILVSVAALAQDKAMVQSSVQGGATVVCEDAETRKAREMEARLAEVLEVNRTLHRTLTDKKRLLRQSGEGAEFLRKRLVGRAVEEPARKSRIEELQRGTGEPEASTARDALQLQRQAQRLEANIAELNDSNLQLSDTHREDRARLMEQQSRLRLLAKRERELGRHLCFLASRLNQAHTLDQGGPKSTNTPAEEGSVDFRNLPGLCLNKLLGLTPEKNRMPRPSPSPAAAAEQAEDVL